VNSYLHCSKLPKSFYLSYNIFLSPSSHPPPFLIPPFTPHSHRTMTREKLGILEEGHMTMLIPSYLYFLAIEEIKISHIINLKLEKGSHLKFLFFSLAPTPKSPWTQLVYKNGPGKKIYYSTNSKVQSPS